MTSWSWEEAVTSMGPGSVPPGGAGYAPLHQVRAYWEGLRRGCLVPERGDLDPRGMEQALEHVFLLDRIAPGIARLRLAGRHLADLLGMEPRGMPLTTFFLPMARGAAETLMEEVFSGPAVVELALEAGREIGGRRLEGRMLLLPLMDDGRCDKALGCLVTMGELGRRPRRFAIARQRTEALTTQRPGTGRSTAQGNAAFAEDAAPFRRDGAPPPQPGAPHLRLVKSED